ncbi:MAG: poly-beta-hydroxybutyrate polymerase, partial [Rhodobacteraceae bacterium]|nr:poly-beta-hydroxybutyrate polymerase [Paracoccaceae bacterium]MCF8521204.1 poly-beta-hydroxybutyrate polymerase [Paracoccaceae bacterium]
APWHSVFKFHLLTDTEMTFLLASGGHNGGIVSEPGHPGRHLRVRTRKAQDRFIDPDSWFAQTMEQEGSWWPIWADWLAQRASARVAPPPMGAPERGLDPLANAPGSYVLQA